MSTPTKGRLIWIAAALQTVLDNGWLRYEGHQKFSEAKGELDDVIATFVDNSAAPVPVTLAAMTPEQVDTVVTRLAGAVPVTDSGAIVTGIVGLISSQIEQSDLAVMGAIVQSQGDIITALTPAPEPAPVA